MYYAVFNPETKIVFALDETDFIMSGNDRVRISKNDPSIIGKEFIGTVDDKEHPLEEFKDQQTQTLSISLDQDLVSQGEQVTAIAEVKDQAGNLLPVNDTYYAPVIRTADNWQAKLLEVQFKEGQATVQFTINEPGIYTIDLTKVYPKPKSELASNPILVVKEKV